MNPLLFSERVIVEQLIIIYLNSIILLGYHYTLVLPVEPYTKKYCKVFLETWLFTI